MSERDDLIETLARHRGFLLHTSAGLTEEQARATSTVSALTIAALLKHVADTEEQWMRFAADGAAAFGDLDGIVADWSAADESTGAESTGAEAAAGGGTDEEWGDWEDTRFTLTDADTVARLRDRVLEVAAATERLLREADLEVSRALPLAPWFEPGVSWSVRRVALHLIAEISQHAGHADIIREAIDGQRTMG